MTTSNTGISCILIADCVVRGFIEDRLRQHNLSSTTTKWINIPKSIKSRAIEIYESKAHEVLHLQLSSCEGSWIAQHCLHSGWNNFVGPERRSERESQTENGRKESASSISLMENQEPTVSNGRGRGRGTQRERGNRVRGRGIGRGTVSRARGRGRGRSRDQGREVREDSINSNSTLNEDIAPNTRNRETTRRNSEVATRTQVLTIKKIMIQPVALLLKNDLQVAPSVHDEHQKETKNSSLQKI
ncbi:hypothetical protein BDC45DRAFT_536660 [Circinella umbellata]|nr:hypothetical protein BDC45DRAFT_536660 [Circinella umbellata]